MNLKELKYQDEGLEEKIKELEYLTSKMNIK